MDVELQPNAGKRKNVEDTTEEQRKKQKFENELNAKMTQLSPSKDPKMTSFMFATAIIVSLMTKLSAIADPCLENFETFALMIANYIIRRKESRNVFTKETFAQIKGPETINWKVNGQKFDLVQNVVKIEEVYYSNAIYKLYKAAYAESKKILLITYIGEGPIVHEAISSSIKEKDTCNEMLRQGTALYLLAVEQFHSMLDSSGMTVRVRSDGTRAKRTKNDELSTGAANTIYSSESTLTAHMAGFSLPGRLAKSLRVDVGAGLHLEEALMGAIKMSRRNENRESLKIATQNLHTALANCKVKLHPAQSAVMAQLQITSFDVTAKATICALVSSTLDVIFPMQNRPVLPHPAFAPAIGALFDAGKMIFNVYSLANFKGAKFTANCYCLEGFVDMKAVQQALAITFINNVYGPLDLVTSCVGGLDNLRQRNDCVGPLKTKICGTVPEFEIITDKVLNNFNRGVGTEKNHQNILTPSIRVSTFKTKPYFHRANISKGQMTGRDPRGALSSILKRQDLVEKANNENALLNLGSIMEANIARPDVAYFNKLTAQTDDEIADAVAQWIAVGNSIKRNPDFDFSD
uniref:Nucleoprotein n=1 Tax=Panagrolaimus sp. PS1159 TaxID=55785 RepID=A0AC35GYV8_9BILA